jgi:hypothetical protein
MIEIDGRKWRKTDPSIPEPLRQQLVNELMSARRAVKDGSDVKAARARVQDAKVALGERGPPWWKPMDDAQYAARAEATIRALLRERGPDKTICPSEVARAIGGEQWRKRMALVREVAEQLVSAGTLEVRQKGARVEPRTARGPIRLALPTR